MPLDFMKSRVTDFENTLRLFVAMTILKNSPLLGQHKDPLGSAVPDLTSALWKGHTNPRETASSLISPPGTDES